MDGGSTARGARTCKQGAARSGTKNKGHARAQPVAESRHQHAGDGTQQGAGEGLSPRGGRAGQGSSQILRVRADASAKWPKWPSGGWESVLKAGGGVLHATHQTGKAADVNAFPRGRCIHRADSRPRSRRIRAAHRLFDPLPQAFFQAAAQHPDDGFCQPRPSNKPPSPRRR